MVEKRISIYGELEARSPFNNDQLVFEVSNTHIALMVKLAGKHNVGAFELFEFDRFQTEWYDIFYQVRTESKILGRSYIDARVYYNLCEAMVMPANKFSTTAAETYLEAIYGNNNNEVIKYDNVDTEASQINIYRIQKSLFDMVNSNLIMVTARHTYSKLLEDIFNKGHGQSGIFLKLQFYYGQVIAVVMRDGKLQLIRLFRFQTADDILYYLLSISRQFHLSATDTPVEVSGIIDVKSRQFECIGKVFGKILLDTVVADDEFHTHSKSYPVHYFTPFFNLMA